MFTTLKRFIVSGFIAVVVSSCDDAPPGTTAPVISETLEGVAEILTGDVAEPKPAEESAPKTTSEGKPVLPTAERVPDKPGFVISPYNGKWIDVTGIPVGEAVADPDFPPEAKKYFRVPEPLAVPEAVEPPAEEVEAVPTELDPTTL